MVKIVKEGRNESFNNFAYNIVYCGTFNACGALKFHYIRNSLKIRVGYLRIFNAYTCGRIAIFCRNDCFLSTLRKVCVFAIFCLPYPYGDSAAIA